eukprot:m.112944 g.112944  ORF g.112944 m.112944 type:complete len:1353 (-) comp10791_c0_seq1:100-4158(-)
MPSTRRSSRGRRASTTPTATPARRPQRGNAVAEDSDDDDYEAPVARVRAAPPARRRQGMTEAGQPWVTNEVADHWSFPMHLDETFTDARLRNSRIFGLMLAIWSTFSTSCFIGASLDLSRWVAFVLTGIVLFLLESVRLGGPGALGTWASMRMKTTRLVVVMQVFPIMLWTPPVLTRFERFAFEATTGTSVETMLFTLALIAQGLACHFYYCYFKLVGILDSDEVQSDTDHVHWIPHTRHDISHSDINTWLGRLAMEYYLFVLASVQMYVFDLNETWIVISMASTSILLSYLPVVSPREVGEWMRWQPWLAVAAAVSSVFLLLTSWSRSDLLPVELRTILHMWTTIKVPGTGGLLSLSAIFSLANVVVVVGVLLNLFKRQGLRLRDTLILSAPLIMLLIYSAFNNSASCGLVVGVGYTPDANQTELLQTIRNEVWTRAGSGTAHADRVLHAKAHACAKAQIIVREELHPDNRVGVFAHPGKAYDAYLRFSNGAGVFQPDSTADVRGFAIKLVDVDPPVNAPQRLMGVEDLERRTQDIVLVSTPYFFTGRVDDYAALFKATLSTSGLLHYVFNSWNPLTWTAAPLIRALRMARNSSEMTNPLNWNYYTATPYRFGATPHSAAKLFVVPCEGYESAERDERDMHRRLAGNDTDYLRTAMRQQLLKGDACFDLRVMRQTDACTQPLDDPTVTWEGPSDSIATILIPRQETLKSDFMGFCENLSFNPWHGFADHEPLGAINRVRRDAYLAGAHTRRTLNGIAKPKEPTGKEVFRGEALPNPGLGAGVTKYWRYGRYPSPFDGLPRKLLEFPAQGILALIKSVFVGIPKDQPQFFDVEKAARIASYAIGVFKTRRRWNRVGKPFEEWTTPQDYDTLFDPSVPSDSRSVTGRLPIPEIAKDGVWATDEAFGWQYIRGINPMVITNVTTAGYPKLLDLSPKRVAEIERKTSQSLEGLRQRGLLFSADYGVLESIPTEAGRVVYSPILLLRRDGHRLLPMVIQLTRYADNPARNRQFYPDDSKTWLFAKMIVANADAIHHEMSTHLALTHLVMEPIVIGFHRQLKASHPIFKLMVPHFRQTIAINELGRKTLLSPTDSIIGNVVGTGITGALYFMQKQYKAWNFTESAFPHDLARRGFHEVAPESSNDHLPGFFYRDDGFRIWHAIEAYIGSVLKTAGYDNDTVKGDKELQALVKDLSDPLLGGVKGIPTIDTVDKLVFFLTNIFFTATAQHSAVNFGQFDFLGFVPGRPLTLTKGMPTDPSIVDDKYIMSALPGIDKTWATIQVIRIISLPADHTLDPFSSEPMVPSLMAVKNTAFPNEHAAFVKKLEKIEEEMRSRNGRWESSYRYLYPSQIAGSIAI